jgi:putative protease
MVKDYDPETKVATILQKNRVFEGEEVEVLTSNAPYYSVKLNEMYDIEKDIKTNVANRAHMVFTAKVDIPVRKNDMLVKSNKKI